MDKRITIHPPNFVCGGYKKWDSDLKWACLNFMALWPRMVWMEQSWMWALYKGFFLLFIVITVIMKLLVNEQLWAKAAIIYIFKLAFFFWHTCTIPGYILTRRWVHRSLLLTSKKLWQEVLYPGFKGLLGTSSFHSYVQITYKY